MKSIQSILGYAKQHRESPMALASLVRTHGSTYRKPGARMLITPGGQTLGVLSGGCLEEIIAQDGLDVLRDGQARLRMIDTRQYFGCEGRLEIFVERIEAAGENGNVLTDLADRIGQRSQICLGTRFSGSNVGSALANSFPLRINEDEVYIQRMPLPVRLFVFGQGPEIVPLKALADTLGWILHVFDHPTECGSEWIGDSQTAALVMNHHFGKDAEAMLRILPMSLPYIGILGPRRRTQQLLSHLLDDGGGDPSSLDSVHSPAGLDIGSESPEEIVLSIVSEILAVLSGHQAGFLSHRHEAVPALRCA
ncbi:MAG: XdhC family protein [Verrucomicrobiota bacterium]